MASVCVFFFSSSLTSGLSCHMLDQFYNDAMSDSVLFKSKVSYEIECAG